MLIGSNRIIYADSMSRYFLGVVSLSLALVTTSCDRRATAINQRGAKSPSVSLSLSVRDDGTATPLWARGISISLGESEANALIDENIQITPPANAWLQILSGALPQIGVRTGELADLFDVPPIDAVVVAGNRGSSDAFGWIPNQIGINVQAFADTYGWPDPGATDRMVRISAHEYLHLLTYASYPHHRDLRQTPLDRALWTIFFEGIGDYVSVSRRWLPGRQGDYSPVAADTLRALEPIFVEQLEKMLTADREMEKRLRTGISMGKFEKKWGSLPLALWLHSAVKQCGESNTLQAIFRLERDSVLLLASRYAAPDLKPRIEELQRKTGRAQSEVTDETIGCLSTLRGL